MLPNLNIFCYFCFTLTPNYNFYIDYIFDLHLICDNKRDRDHMRSRNITLNDNDFSICQVQLVTPLP